MILPTIRKWNEGIGFVLCCQWVLLRKGLVSITANLEMLWTQDRAVYVPFHRIQDFPELMPLRIKRRDEQHNEKYDRIIFIVVQY